MIFFLMFARALQIALIALRAAAGIMIVGHGVHIWVKNKSA